jgi:hypothetical protein
MLTDFEWKIESDGNWFKIKYGVPSSNVKSNEHLYFDYVSHETLNVYDTFFVSQTQLGFAIVKCTNVCFSNPRQMRTCQTPAGDISRLKGQLSRWSLTD